ncbi:hypothetical protein [Streptomyces sp. NPDC002463]|uniref:hypothetical protein n=1 Tax=Streptomyces sp. NPDC002463 TaxID=3364645 RepID=UPI0036816A4F
MSSREAVSAEATPPMHATPTTVRRKSSASLVRPAVSAGRLRGRTGRDPRPALDRLSRAGVLVARPRLAGALIHPRLLAVLEAPLGTAAAAAGGGGAG